jgi:4-hydroxy-3-polyprenylbenzoate decarboxylase
VDAFQKNKHWGCNGPLIIDARIKPHHAPVLELNAEVEQKVDAFMHKYE